MARTRQEIFDLAWNGLKAQGFRVSKSKIAQGCAYRSDAGNRKCGIGHCIPDELYKPSFEGRRVADKAVRRAAGIGPRDLDFAFDLQACHDRADGARDMERNLRRLAAEYRLTIPQPSPTNQGG